MTAYDGPTLRAVRENIGMPLRRIARAAGMSHGHLSKVERGEYGRPVTPAILAAYERVTGISLTEAVAGLSEPEPGSKAAEGRQRTWLRGQMSDMRRRGYKAGIGALAVGGYVGEPYLRLLDSTGRPLSPTPPGPVEVEQLEQFTETAIVQDLRHGGGLVYQLAKAMLRWAVPMLDAGDMDEAVRRRLYAAVGALAHRTAWAAFDASAHDPARSLFRLALYAAVLADDANLRAHVLADVAAQQNDVGYPEDALEIIRFVEGDERMAPPIRMVIQGVKARAFAALGDADACRRCVTAAEQHHHQADRPTPRDWVGTLRHTEHLQAMTGHAFAELAARSGSPEDLRQARQRLTEAIDSFDPDHHSRAHALCVTRLARLLLDADDLEHGEYFAHLALRSAARLRSTRLTRELAFIRTKAASFGEEPAMRKLVEAIDDAERWVNSSAGFASSPQQMNGSVR